MAIMDRIVKTSADTACKVSHVIKQMAVAQRVVVGFGQTHSAKVI